MHQKGFRLNLEQVCLSLGFVDDQTRCFVTDSHLFVDLATLFPRGCVPFIDENCHYRRFGLGYPEDFGPACFSGFQRGMKVPDPLADSGGGWMVLIMH